MLKEGLKNYSKQKLQENIAKYLKNCGVELFSKGRESIDEDYVEVNVNEENKEIILLKKEEIEHNDSYIEKFALQRIYNRDYFLCTGLELAKKLIGKVIQRTVFSPKKESYYFRIVETEAYMAPEDKACHAYNNLKNSKTKYFWCVGGSCYVFHIYSPQNMCFNIIAGDDKTPHGVLIRAVEPLTNESINYMATIRDKVLTSKDKLENPSRVLKDYFNGPAKSGMSMGIDKSYNGEDCLNSTRISLFEYSSEPKFEIVSTPRVNIDYAGEYVDKPWRFYIKNNGYVSKAKQNID